MRINRPTNRRFSKPTEATTLKEKFAEGTSPLVPAFGIAAGGAAAYFAGDLLSLGDGGLIESMGGTILGVGMGYAAGALGSKLYEKYSGDDPAGKAAVSAMVVASGIIGGGLTGLVGGAFGANPFVAVPASLLGGAAGLSATLALHSAVFGKGNFQLD